MRKQKPEMDAVIIHIPHSSLYIPEKYRASFLPDASGLEAVHLRLTDWYCDELYRQEGFTQYAVAGVSRLLCDMERFRNDEEEDMSQYGLGAIYTHTDEGKPLKQVSEEQKEEILKTYYDPHHALLTELVEKALDKYGRCLIIDGHSFDSHFFLTPPDDSGWSDFDIGTDKYHTPEELKDYMKKTIENDGYRVSINEPYSGALVPMKYYANNKAVSSIMFELNRRNYMDNATGEKNPAFDAFRAQTGKWMKQAYEFWRDME